MKTLSIMTALVIAMMPTLAFASCGGHEQRSASSCMEGYVWDSGAQACVEKATS